MFIKKITICNMFAYYGEVSAEFIPQNDKNLYCIYGDNGFGKTSFIRCAKLLFLGSGLMDTNSINIPSIPSVISRFSPKTKTPIKLIKGDTNNWRGILNANAIKELKEDFYICFEGEINQKKFILKRSWNDIYDSDTKEELSLYLDGQWFSDDEAQSKINSILPPKFVEFFFFDGEEIENISDNLRSELREKIEEILQIEPLNIIIKQIDKYKNDLKDDEIKNKTHSQELKIKRRQKESKEQEIFLAKDIIAGIQNRTEELRAESKKIDSEINKLKSNSSKEAENMQNEIQATQIQLIEYKETLKKSLKNIIFTSNNNILALLQKEINLLQTSKKKGDIDVLKRLMPEIKEIALEGLKTFIKLKSFDKARSRFESVLDSIPQKLESKSFANSYIIPSMMGDILGFMIRLEENDTLYNEISAIKRLKDNMRDLNNELNELNSDDYTKQRLEELNAHKTDIDEKLSHNEQEMVRMMENLKNLEIEKDRLERDIDNMEQNINTERIDDKLEMLDILQTSIETYKDRLIVALREELRLGILENYNMLLPNDNINDIEISERFEIRLKDSDGENIIAESQSSGQRQILAISIFWALSKLSSSHIPLIIDTPLSRIDAHNRERIIRNYYAQDSQVIILPHSGEMGQEGIYFCEAAFSRSIQN